MSEYTSEYLQEKLQKEFNPIHLVRLVDMLPPVGLCTLTNPLCCPTDLDFKIEHACILDIKHV